MNDLQNGLWADGKWYIKYLRAPNNVQNICRKMVHSCIVGLVGFQPRQSTAVWNDVALLSGPSKAKHCFRSFSLVKIPPSRLTQDDGTAEKRSSPRTKANCLSVYGHYHSSSNAIVPKKILVSSLKSSMEQERAYNLLLAAVTNTRSKKLAPLSDIKRRTAMHPGTKA